MTESLFEEGENQRWFGFVFLGTERSKIPVSQFSESYGTQGPGPILLTNCTRINDGAGIGSCDLKTWSRARTDSEHAKNVLAFVSKSPFL
jgi:hypothetical protein